jgi:hypothetical protein
VQLQPAVSILKAELQRASLVALDSPTAAYGRSRPSDVTRSPSACALATAIGDAEQALVVRSGALSELSPAEVLNRPVRLQRAPHRRSRCAPAQVGYAIRDRGLPGIKLCMQAGSRVVRAPSFFTRTPDRD